jgi:cyanophycinase-like exopeptidase
MVLCEHYYDPYEKKLLRGLNLIPSSCVLPHHNNFGRSWAKPLIQQMPNSTLIGIDEHTGMINDTDGTWHIHGAGKVTLYQDGKVVVHIRSKAFYLE